jgi:hypothetical protein
MSLGKIGVFPPLQFGHIVGVQLDGRGTGGYTAITPDEVLNYSILELLAHTNIRNVTPRIPTAVHSIHSGNLWQLRDRVE